MSEAGWRVKRHDQFAAVFEQIDKKYRRMKKPKGAPDFNSEALWWELYWHVYIRDYPEETVLGWFKSRL